MIESVKIGETLTYFGTPVIVRHILGSKSAIVEFMEGERMGTKATLTFKRLERVG